MYRDKLAIVYKKLICTYSILKSKEGSKKNRLILNFILSKIIALSAIFLCNDTFSDKNTAQVLYITKIMQNLTSFYLKRNLT